MSYQPLAGVKVLDLGILIPAALTSGKLAALGAEVVKVEQPPNGDRLRVIPPIGDDGESPQHMSQSWGKRSIGLDVRDAEDRAVILALAQRADIIVENQLAGFWAGQGIDFAALRAGAALADRVLGDRVRSDRPMGLAAIARPEHGRPRRHASSRVGRRTASSGPDLHQLGQRARHRLRRDGHRRSAGRRADDWRGRLDRPVLLGRARRSSPRGHRHYRAREAPSAMQRMGRRQSLYDTYLSSDGVPVLLGALEPKFWKRFCENIGRADLIGRHTGAALAFGDNDDDLRAELEKEFGRATAAEWLQRFIDWDVPGGPVLDVPQIMATDHFAARQITEGERRRVAQRHDGDPLASHRRARRGQAHAAAEVRPAPRGGLA